MNKLKLCEWTLGITFFLLSSICLFRYLDYINAVILFPYEWGPSDGDHLNFAHRLAKGLPIYFSMKTGSVLSIYTPLFGGEHASMAVARIISFLFWLASPLLVGCYFRKRWGYFYAGLAAVLIWISPEPYMLMTAVYVTPTTTMAFLFLAALIYCNYCLEEAKNSFWQWPLLGIITALCYLAKQPGIIAIASVFFIVLIRGLSAQKIGLILIGFIFVFIPSTIYLEVSNSGQYLNATFFDLNKITNGGISLSRHRIFDFLFYHHWAFTLCVIISFYLLWLRQIKIDIWHVSFLLHVPLLLFILKNGGGGADYFLSFWIVIVLINIGLIKNFWSNFEISKNKSEITKRNLKKLGGLPATLLCIIVIIAAILLNFWIAIILVSFGFTKKGKDFFKILINKIRLRQKNLIDLPRLLIALLFINGATASISIVNEMQNFPMPTNAMQNLMRSYDNEIGKLVSSKSSVLALTNRNIGALVSHNINVENEGSTQFQYLWHLQTESNRKSLISKIKAKNFDLITTGLQSYPEEIQRSIKENYKLAFNSEIVLNSGKTGVVFVYIPKHELP